MRNTGGSRHGRWSTAVTGVLGLAMALVVAGCTSTPPAADAQVTVTSTVGPATDPAMATDPATSSSSTGPVVVPPLNGPKETDAPSTDIQVEPTSSVAPTSTTKPTTKTTSTIGRA